SPDESHDVDRRAELDVLFISGAEIIEWRPKVSTIDSPDDNLPVRYEQQPPVIVVGVFRQHEWPESNANGLNVSAREIVEPRTCEVEQAKPGADVERLVRGEVGRHAQLDHAHGCGLGLLPLVAVEEGVVFGDRKTDVQVDGRMRIVKP